MKACYGELKVPNVPKTHSWTPDKVKSLSHAGNLYVCAFKPLMINAHDEQNTSITNDTSNDSKLQVSGTTYAPVCDSEYKQRLAVARWVLGVYVCVCMRACVRACVCVCERDLAIICVHVSACVLCTVVTNTPAMSSIYSWGLWYISTFMMREQNMHKVVQCHNKLPLKQIVELCFADQLSTGKGK